VQTSVTASTRGDICPRRDGHRRETIASTDDLAWSVGSMQHLGASITKRVSHHKKDAGTERRRAEWSTRLSLGLPDRGPPPQNSDPPSITARASHKSTRSATIRDRSKRARQFVHDGISPPFAPSRRPPSRGRHDRQ
jgi:hypothetical protein